MLIEDKEIELTEYEPMPRHQELWVAAIQYTMTSKWHTTVSFGTKAELISSLERYSLLEKVRIYKMTLPLRVTD